MLTLKKRTDWGPVSFMLRIFRSLFLISGRKVNSTFMCTGNHHSSYWNLRTPVALEAELSQPRLPLRKWWCLILDTCCQRVKVSSGNMFHPKSPTETRKPVRESVCVWVMNVSERVAVFEPSWWLHCSSSHCLMADGCRSEPRLPTEPPRQLLKSAVVSVTCSRSCPLDRCSHCWWVRWSPSLADADSDLIRFVFLPFSLPISIANGYTPVPLSCTATRIFQYSLWPLVLSVSNDAHRFWQGSGRTSSLISSSLKCPFLSPFPTFTTPHTSHDFTSCCHLHPRLWCSCSNVHPKMQVVQFQIILPVTSVWTFFLNTGRSVSVTNDILHLAPRTCFVARQWVPLSAATL